MNFRQGLIVSFVLAGLVCPAAAQAPMPPMRPNTGGLFGARPPMDPNRSTQELGLTLNLNGGYDDNLQVGELPAGTLGTQGDGYLGTGVAELLYRYGRVNKYASATGRVYRNSASYGTNQWLGGGFFEGATPLGRRSNLIVNVGTEYQPSFLFSGQLTQGPGGDVPGGDPTQGVNDQRWLMTQGTASLERNWTTRQRTSVGYLAWLRRPLTGPGLDSTNQGVSVRHNWDFARDRGFEAAYRFSDFQQSDQAGAQAPLRSHAAEGTLRLQRRLSPTRTLAFSFGGGVNRSEAQTTAAMQVEDITLPTVFAGARLDLGRSWAVAVDVRRDVTVLAGLTLTPFATNNFSLHVDGSVAPRVHLSMNGTYSDGASGTGGLGAYESSWGTATAQFSVSRWCALMTSYTYYSHRVRDLSVVQSGFPIRSDRNSVRAGITFWLPMLGTT